MAFQSGERHAARSRRQMRCNTRKSVHYHHIWREASRAYVRVRTHSTFEGDTNLRLEVGFLASLDPNNLEKLCGSTESDICLL